MSTIWYITISPDASPRHTATTASTAIGTCATSHGHTLRRRSCNNRSSHAIISGTSVSRSSEMHAMSRMVFPAHASTGTAHHTWLPTTVAMNAAAQRLSALGGIFTSLVNALPRVASRYTPANVAIIATAQ